MEVDCRLTTLCQDILVNHMIYRNLTKRLKVTTNLKATILLLVLMVMSQGHMDMETLPNIAQQEGGVIWEPVMICLLVPKVVHRTMVEVLVRMKI